MQSKFSFSMDSCFFDFLLRLVRHIFDKNRGFDDNGGEAKGTADQVWLT